MVFFIVAITVNRREKKIVAKARVHTRGFVYLKKSRDILRESSELINQTVEDYLQGDDLTGQILKGRFVIILPSISLTKPNVVQPFYQ